ncbi:MAG: hypothetical protein ACRDTD_29880 [Pseudonocardiaceae bacterium]
MKSHIRLVMSVWSAGSLGHRWHAAEDPGRYRTTATMDLALSLGAPEHTPVFGYDRLLTHDSTPAPTLADGAGPPQRMIHRRYLPVLITRRVATDTDRHPIAMEETRRSAEDNQLSYPKPPPLHNHDTVRTARPCASVSFTAPSGGAAIGKGVMFMGKHDREKDEDGQVPPDKPIPTGDWVQRDDGGRHSTGQQDDDKRDDEDE